MQCSHSNGIRPSPRSSRRTCTTARSWRSLVTRVAAGEARTSLVPQTLQEMAEDTELQAHLAQLQQRGQAALTREERRKRQRSLDSLQVPAFGKACADAGVTPLRRKPAQILQINIGLYCNQACSHCHVESSPRRTEMMDRATAERCVQLMRQQSSITTVDITGGAPELNENFRYLVSEARALGLQVIDRCNLTVLLEPGQEDLPAFLAEHGVRVVASLPCYSAKNVDQQRGAGVFERSIAALKILNSRGYGQPGSDLTLDLVYNPGGAFLAPAQTKLEPAYKQELGSLYGISFNSLLCLNNMPIKRFADFLLSRGQMDEYMQLLVQSFNAAAAEGLMCRDTVSVGWDGRLYDCDFNQQLELLMPAGPHRGSTAGSGAAAGSKALTVFDISSLEELSGRVIAVDNHCFGCTAGAGSSCQGATS